MLHLEEFNAALEREGLPPAYHWDAAVLAAQQALERVAHSAVADAISCRCARFLCQLW
jgi:hypothetical protein